MGATWRGRSDGCGNSATAHGHDQRVPPNLILLPPPPYAPELRAQLRNIWQFMRATWLSNRIFESYDAIIAAACEAWRSLIAQPKTITSIGMRKWARIGQS